MGSAHGPPGAYAVELPAPEVTGHQATQELVVKPWNKANGFEPQRKELPAISAVEAWWESSTLDNISAGTREGRENIGRAALGVGENIVGTAVHTWKKGFFSTMLDGLGHIGNGAKIAWESRGGAFLDLGKALWQSFKEDPSQFFANLGVNLLTGIYSPNLLGGAAKVIAKPIEALAKQTPGLVQQGLTALGKLVKPAKPKVQLPPVDKGVETNTPKQAKQPNRIKPTVDPNVPAPSFPSESIFGRPLPEWGREIIRWGSGSEEALARMRTITLAELRQNGVTLAQANAGREFYAGVLARNRGNAAAAARVQLMDYIIRLLGGG